MFDEKSYNLKMDKTIEVFSKELSSLRTGRANAAMLDLIKVEVYGQQMPINQIGSITTPEPRMINIQIWDQSNVSLVDSAIRKSELGLNPQIDGQLIRLPIPELNEERRTELKKLIKSMGEKCKIAIRNIRRDGNEEFKRLLKSKQISEDDEKSFQKKKSRNFGHKAGLKTIEKIVDVSLNLDIKYLTLYTFSKENWKRPKKEISEDDEKTLQKKFKTLQISI